MFARVSFAKQHPPSCYPVKHTFFSQTESRRYAVVWSMPCKSSCPCRSYNSITVLCPFEHHATSFIAPWSFRTWTGPPKSKKTFKIWFDSLSPWYPWHRLLSFLLDPISSTSHNALAVVSRGGQLGSQLIGFRGGIVPRGGPSNSFLVWHPSESCTFPNAETSHIYRNQVRLKKNGLLYKDSFF